MALNQPYSKDIEVEDIILNNNCELLAGLKKEGVDLELDDLEYEFFSREESIGVKSEKIYPDEDLPAKFGVYRGYNGGGIHGGLVKTEIDRLTVSRQPKAQRLLELFKQCFWAILKEIDSLDEKIEPKESWDRLTI